jgi:predicted O-methyltransferase YrrM
MGNFVSTKISLDITQHISNNMLENTFHHHFHFLYDLRSSIDKEIINYVEIGTFCGASSCLMLNHPKQVNVIAIDIGTFTPGGIDTIYQNVEKFKLNHNQFELIVGDSHSFETLNILKSKISEIDILFIDGDHSYSGTTQDFNNYKDLVVSGGYIVFDDYHDYQYSPEVKPAVDDIINSLNGEFEIIGCIENTFNAHPSDWVHNNGFILKKL